MMPYRFIDIFAGIGGFRLALQKKGMKCVFSSEIDKRAKEVYEENFKESPAGDIREINEKDIPPHDILCAGFPCQSFSISGRHGGLKDTRGQLFYEIVRIARYHRPLILLLENVKNILTINSGKTIKTIEKKLKGIGYITKYFSLNSSLFGIPQKRERIYFTCVRNDINIPNELKRPPRPTMRKIYLKDILDKSVDSSLFINRDDIVMKGDLPMKELCPIRIGHLNKGGQGERIYSTNGHAITLSANGGGIGARTGLYYANGGIRKLSIDECKRLMGFPLTHQVSSGYHGYKQLGNAVIPKMISKIYDHTL